ncbi:DNA polymerase-4 [Puniceicoccus vermicola]
MTDSLASSSSRKIIHVDMDCFYAAVEMRDDPALRKVALAVGGSGRRGVVCTCNYKARSFGVRSAMPNFMALQRCPELVFVRPRFEHYREISRGIREIFYSYTPLVEPLSLDEAYLDVSGLGRPATEIATEIRERIRKTFRLPVSAGVAPNKLLAKIASDWRKPNGQFVIRPSGVEKFMEDLPVRRLWGVGRRAEEKLERMGCSTCKELRELSIQALEEAFGKFGLELYYQARGQDERAVQPSRIRKSLSNERTYSEEIRTEEELIERVGDLHEELCADLASRPELRDKIAGPFVKVKFTDFSQTTISRTGIGWDLPVYVELGKEAFSRKEIGARLLGVGVRFVESGTVGGQLLLQL